MYGSGSCRTWYAKINSIHHQEISRKSEILMLSENAQWQDCLNHAWFMLQLDTGALSLEDLHHRSIDSNLITFLNLDSPPQLNHKCDNQELIVKVKSMLPAKWAWWWHDVTDSDLICKTLHWGRKIQWTPRWE